MPGTCNSDADCKSVNELCRDHRCIDKNSGSGDPDAAISPDGGNLVPDAEGDSQGDADIDPLAGCANVLQVQPRRDPLVLEIVLDGSGSMTDANKWTAASQALNQFFFDLKTAPATSDLAIGLLIFEDANDPTAGAGPYPSAIDVAPALIDNNQANALSQRMNTTPSGSTPTLAALNGGYKALRSFNAPGGSPLANARKLALLVSDGSPNGGLAEQASCSTAAGDALAAAAPQGPLETHAIGIGPFPSPVPTAYAPQFLSELTVAGGTRNRQSCDPTTTTKESDLCHTQVTTGAPVGTLKRQLMTALTRAISGATGCTLPIAAAPAFNPGRVRISLLDEAGAATLVTASQTNGWTFDNPSAPTQVILSGAACDAYLRWSTVKIEACAP